MGGGLAAETPPTRRYVTALQAEYQDWRDQLPESLADSRTAVRVAERPDGSNRMNRCCMT